jgi:hypothetical protein
MFTYQFTLARIKIFGIRFHMLLSFITDVTTKKYYYNQDFVLFGMRFQKKIL